MKKYLLCSMLTAAFFVMPLSAAPTASAKKDFQTAIKHVDLGGEMLYYFNTGGIIKLINEKLPQLVQVLTKGEAEAQTINNALKSALKVLNLNAVKAFAQSSKKLDDQCYVYKTFTLIDRNEKSLLINPASRNMPSDWTSLPADTRFALKTDIDLGYVWQIIFKEIQNNPDPQIQSLSGMVALLKSQGIDLAQMAFSVKGNIEILVTGGGDNIAFKVSVPDVNGSLSAMLKQQFVQETKGNTTVIASELGEITILYAPGKITAYSNKKLLSAPNLTILENPNFKKSAALLPANANAYVIVDIPQEFIAFLKEQVADEPPLAAVIDMMLPPMSVAGVSEVAPAGLKFTAVSNISLVYLSQLFGQGLGLLIL